jgi:hypothetical protein
MTPSLARDAVTFDHGSMARPDHSGGINVQVLGRPHATRYIDRLFERYHFEASFASITTG